MPRPILTKPKRTLKINIRKRPSSSLSDYLRIYRKSASNLHIRENILRAHKSDYETGPSLIWTEDAADLAIFTDAEDYTNFIGFESPFCNPKSPKFLKKILQNMRMKQGTILIKEAGTDGAMHIPVHFCAYRVDHIGEFTIFDPSWHSADRGIYSTTTFYDSLDMFGISYKHAYPDRKWHWQSLLPNDVFCQTWTLQWLLSSGRFNLPKTSLDAATQLANYVKTISRFISHDIERYLEVFPRYKLEGNDPRKVFHHIITDRVLAKNIYELF